jgi:hypothetical protein
LNSFFPPHHRKTRSLYISIILQFMTDKRQDPPEEHLEHRLALFNAKEPFTLIQRVLGVKVEPHADFLHEILKACNITAKPENVFCGMDFHLDWLYAALMINPLTEELLPLAPDATGQFPMTGSQLDADFVICFTEHDGAGKAETHLLLIEAKGVGAWDTAQMMTKLKQYRAMKPAFERNPGVRPRLILMSPKDPFESPTRQSGGFLSALKSFEDFGEIRWIELKMEETFKVIRCNDKGHPNGISPTHWKLRRR